MRTASAVAAPTQAQHVLRRSLAGIYRQAGLVDGKCRPRSRFRLHRRQVQHLTGPGVVIELPTVRATDNLGYPSHRGPPLGSDHDPPDFHQVADFVRAVAKGKAVGPTFRDALNTQYVCDAVLKSGKTNKWEKVKQA